MHDAASEFTAENTSAAFVARPPRWSWRQHDFSNSIKLRIVNSQQPFFIDMSDGFVPKVLQRFKPAVHRAQHIVDIGAQTSFCCWRFFRDSKHAIRLLGDILDFAK